MKTLMSVSRPFDSRFLELASLLNNLSDIFADCDTSACLRQIGFNPSVVRADVDKIDLYPFDFVVATLPWDGSASATARSRANLIAKASRQHDKKFVISDESDYEDAIGILYEFRDAIARAAMENRPPPEHVPEEVRAIYGKDLAALNLERWERASGKAVIVA